jgi:sugar phosphate isomerase/epimerase
MISRRSNRADSLRIVAFVEQLLGPCNLVTRSAQSELGPATRYSRAAGFWFGAPAGGLFRAGSSGPISDILFLAVIQFKENNVRVGVFTPLLSQLSLEDVLKKLKSNNIDTVELGTGNYPGDAHCKLSMLDNPGELAEFKQKLADHGFTISALSSHGNPLHPDQSRAKRDQETSRKTIRLAEKLGVPVVVDFSGCPGDSPASKWPNWVTCPWPPDYLEILKWQWEEVVTPYWIEHAKFAADHGVKVAIEMHPGFVVYSPETMLKLRSIAGPSVGCNYDPSHMFWQAIDPIAAIRVLGDSIFHVHAKDTQIYERNLPLTGVLDTKSYTDERNRAWIFRTCGYGHGDAWWKEFASTLRMFGYDYVLSIEHEDSLLSPEEGLTKAAAFLNGLVMKQKPAAAWWV